jgi:hypothetical protein
MIFRCFFASVSFTCFKCFVCLLLYIASVVSRCFKSRSGITHIAMAIHICFKVSSVFQTYVSSILFGCFKSSLRVLLLLLLHPRGSPCHHGSPHAPATVGSATTCIRVRETERAQGGPRTCMGPCSAGRGSWVR